MKKLLSEIKRRILSAVSQGLKKISPTSAIIGPPKGYYNTVKEYMQHETVSPTCYHELYERMDIKVPKDPVTVNDDIHWRFVKNGRYSFPEQYVIEIEEGRVIGTNCFIITPSDYLIGEVSRQFGIKGDYEKNPLFKAIKLPAIESLDSVLGVVGYAGSDNYWHWMFDVLPRIFLLKKSGLFDKCDKIIINPLLYPYQQYSLRQLGIPEEKFIFSGKKVHIKAKKLLVPSIPEYAEHVPAWSIDFLRDVFDFRNVISPASDKVYITRNKAMNRKVTNEADVLDILTPLGFKVVAMEDLTVYEQINLFSQASLIIAPHGASQTNLIFCKPGCKVIELFSPLWIHYCYWSMSSLLNIEYYYLLGEGEVFGEHNYRQNKGADISIDIDKFKSVLIKAGVIKKDVICN